MSFLITRVEENYNMYIIFRHMYLCVIVCNSEVIDVITDFPDNIWWHWFYLSYTNIDAMVDFFLGPCLNFNFLLASLAVVPSAKNAAGLSSETAGIPVIPKGR